MRMLPRTAITRRDSLKLAAATAGAALGWPGVSPVIADDLGPLKPKPVAAVITAYKRGMHADVLIGKILEGWKQDGGPGPALTLASLYVDQFPDGDLSRSLAAKYGVPIFETIEQAVTVGGDQVAVDGVISVGEHGDYPWNEKQQHLYPRRRFFEEITAAFIKYGRVVPIFSDKHLGPVWEDAHWMYERARELDVPFMAGSSMTVGYRVPDATVPMDCEIEAAVGIGYAGLDIYGSHTLEFYQCQVERRLGGERGVRSVQCLQGAPLWKAVDDGLVSQELVDAALAITPHQNDRNLRDSEGATLFLFEYVDGLLGCVLMLPSYVRGTAVAVRLRGEQKPFAVRFDERTEPRYPHFAWLLKGIERMVHTGRPSYPVERTLLTSGILDRALTSLSEGQAQRKTPELEIRYQPVDYPHAPRPDLLADPRL